MASLASGTTGESSSTVGDGPLGEEEEEEEDTFDAYAAAAPLPMEVTGFAWHPYLPKWALARPDNSVHLLDLASDGSGSWEPLVLTHKLQRDITQVAWNPLGGNMLAVSCREGICLWNFVSAAPAGAASAVRRSAWMMFLKNPTSSSLSLMSSAATANASLVISIAWSPCGRYLTSCSQDSSQTLVWDVAKASVPDQGCTSLGPSGASVRLVRCGPVSLFCLLRSVYLTLFVFSFSFVSVAL